VTQGHPPPGPPLTPLLDMRTFPPSLSVLVVDDSRDAADSLADVLRACGHEARTAYTPTEAVIAVGDFAPDAILMDIGIPGMDGYRLARKLCGLLGRRPLLIAVTGCTGLEEWSRTEGFDAHFLKPADPQELLDVLQADAPLSPWTTEGVEEAVRASRDRHLTWHPGGRAGRMAG
jgi:two-component system, OmpR family, response regulator